MKMIEPEEGYCSCDKPTSPYAEHGDFGYWLRCSKCEKVIEDSFEYFNHFDGEDHFDSECL